MYRNMYMLLSACVLSSFRSHTFMRNLLTVKKSHLFTSEVIFAILFLCLPLPIPN